MPRTHHVKLCSVAAFAVLMLLGQELERQDKLPKFTGHSHTQKQTKTLFQGEKQDARGHTHSPVKMETAPQIYT